MLEAILAICTVLGGIAALAYFVEKALAKKRLRSRLPPESPFHAHSDIARRAALSQQSDEARANIADLKSGATCGSTLATPTFTTSIYRVWTQSPHLTEFVKVGWSWPAYFFGPVWALTKRMPLPAGAAILVGVAAAYAMNAAKVSEADVLAFSLVVNQFLGLLFGAYGNTLRERHLAARGFLLRHTTLRTHPVYGPLVAGLRALWANKRLRAASAATVLMVSVATGAYFLVRTSDTERLVAEADIQLVGNCDKALITARVIPHGSETFAWFEWGETPELGRMTIKQRFTEEADYYQHLAGLRESTTYYYKAVMMNAYGRTDCRVRAFKTPRCNN
jgi:hypothetical protein